MMYSISQEVFEDVYSHACPELSEKIDWQYPCAHEFKLYEFIISVLCKRDTEYKETLRELFPSVLDSIQAYDKAMALVECPRF